MALLENLSSLLGESGEGGQQISKALSGLLDEAGGMNNLIDKFKQSGLGDLADSWLGTGENKPITADQLKQVLGESGLGAVAQRMGSGIDEAAGSLAAMLPQVIDQLSPDGQALSDSDVGNALKGVLGKLMG